MSSIISNPQTQCVKKKKDQIEISPISKRLLFCFLNFQYILIHVRKQKLLKGAKGSPLHIHCSILSF